jgi:TRAP-type uncharacterized transport system fused permease subunit
MKTGWTCFRFAKVIYLMPVLFAYTHILFTGTPGQNIAAIASATIGTVMFSIVSTGFFHVRTTLIEWLLLAGATVLAFFPTLTAGAGSVCIFVAVYLWQRRRSTAQLATRPIEIATK